MLDKFVERWCGPLLIVLALLSLAVGIIDIVNLPPPPLLPHEELPKRIILLGGPDPTFRIEALMYGGTAMLFYGVALVQHFHRGRGS